MPLIKLTAAQLKPKPKKPKSRANPEYVAFLSSARKGSGAKAIIKDEGASKQTVKNRLNKAADEAGVKIKFIRSSPEEVIFEVVGKKPGRRASS